METIEKFLGNSVWQGVQGIVALVALILSLRNKNTLKPADLVSERRLNRMWISIFLIAGLSLSFSLGVTYQSAGLFLFVTGAFVLISVAAENYLIRRDFQQADDMNRASALQVEQLTHLLRYSARLNYGTIKHTIGRWNRSHSIDASGDETLIETIEIIAEDHPMYFYAMRYSFNPNVPDSLHVEATTVPDGRPLQIVEYEKGASISSQLIILDPPVHPNRGPSTLQIKCSRKQIWGPLVKTGRDETDFVLPFGCTGFQVEYLAPFGRKWRFAKSIPQVGDLNIEHSGQMSRAMWHVENPQQGRFSVELYLEDV